MNKGDNITGTIAKMKNDRVTVVIINGLRYTLDLTSLNKGAKK